MTIAVAVLAIFAAMAVLMYLNRLPAVVALPLMAIAIALVARVSWQGLATIISSGSLKLHATYTTAILGAVLAEIIAKAGVAETMVRIAAELGGDRPRVLSLLLTAVVALLFTTLGGLGAVIMVATIVFPVLLALGVPQLAAAGLFLLGMSLGGILNMTNWQLYRQALGLSTGAVLSFALPMVGLMAVATVVFALVELRPGRMRRFWSDPVAPPARRAPWYALLAPVVPLVPVVGFAVYNLLVRPAKPFDFPIITAMVIGIAYGLATAPRPPQGRIQLLTRSVVDGIGAVAPAVALMLGIGMLLEAVNHPNVQDRVQPVLTAVLPSSRIGYVVVFSLLAPLALYRGPLNLYGMGSGLAALMARVPGLGPTSVMAALMSVGQLQGACDPTNTHNVWIANYLGVDVQQVLRRTIVYVWPAAVVGLVVGAVMFLGARG
jgi:Na+/H+ antiporter NhaD/arsenite permease-like protein